MAEISHAIYKAGEGEQVVLLHGFTGSWRHWRPVLGELVARYEVIAPTLPGHDGGGEWPKDAPINFEAAADLMQARFAQLGVERAHLVGNSMGGALALELAKRGVAKSVVAIAPGGGWTEGDGEAQRVGKFFAAQTKRTRASAKWLPQIMRRPLTRKIAMRDAMRHGELMAPVDAVDLAMSALRCTVTDRVLDTLMVDRGIAMSGLDQIGCPVLLASPQFDRILPATKHAQRFRREIPGIESMTMPGCGHLPMWDDTALVVNTIVEFVERQRSAESPSLAASPSPVG